MAHQVSSWRGEPRSAETVSLLWAPDELSAAITVPSMAFRPRKVQMTTVQMGRNATGVENRHAGLTRRESTL
jgi:hypothetical protein